MVIEAALISAAASLSTKLISHLLSKEQKLLERQEQTGRERNAKELEAEALARAIGIEIAALVEAAIGRYRWWTDPDKHAKESKLEWIPPLVPFYVEAYEQIKNRIEKLPADIVGATVRFHGYVRFINGLQETRSEYQERGMQADFDKIYQGALGKLIIIGGISLNVFKRGIPELRDVDDFPSPIVG